jgi:opacity protein-like surface antigen
MPQRRDPRPDRARGPALLLLVASVALATAAATAATAAGIGDARGFHLGLGIGASYLDGGGERPLDAPPSPFVDEGGVLAGLTFGYGITETLTLRLSASGARHETSNPEVDLELRGATVDVVYLFRPGSAFRPYVAGGLGGYTVESREDLLRFETEGPATAFGLGAFFFTGEHLAVELGLRGEWINWESTTTRLVLENGSALVVDQPIEDSGFAGKFLLAGACWF